jgi:hypothetical protein
MVQKKAKGQNKSLGWWCFENPLRTLSKHHFPIIDGWHLLSLFGAIGMISLQVTPPRKKRGSNSKRPCCLSFPEGDKCANAAQRSAAISSLNWRILRHPSPGIGARKIRLKMTSLSSE